MLTVLLLALPVGCAKVNTPTPGTEAAHRINIVASVFAPYDFARQVAGDRADVAMLLPPAAESHSYEPTPQDIIKISHCDVFIYVGGESDDWIKEILSSMDTTQMAVVTLMDCVDVVEEAVIDGMQAQPDAEPEYDEHVWTAPTNAMLIVQKIADAICGADVDNAAFYRQNASDYISELQGLDAEFQAVVDGGARKVVLFGDRFPFRYFADAYGLEYYAAFPGCSAQTEPSTATVRFLIDKINTEHIPVVFYIELGNERLADAICEDTGAKPLLLHSCHNITKEDFLSGVGYLELMRQNVQNLIEALQ